MPKRNNIRLTKTKIDQAPLGGTIWDTEVSGFGVRTTPSGVRAFILQYRTHQGDQGKLTLGRFPTMTVEEARKLAREHRVAIDKGGNPCKGVEKCPENARWEYLPPEHVRRLLGACDAHHDQEGANAIRILLFTGARKCEVLRAEWSQFDLEKGYWNKPSSHTKVKRLHRLALAPETVERLALRGVRVHCLALGGVDLTSPAGKMTMGVIASVAEFERDLLVERTQSGLRRAKSEGKTLGRPAVLSHEQQQQIVEKRAAGASLGALAKEFNVTKSAIQRAEKRCNG